MKKGMKRFLVGLLYENNEPSLTRVLFAASFILVVAAMVYDWVHGWPPFLEFAKQVLALILGAKTADVYYQLGKKQPAGGNAEGAEKSRRRVLEQRGPKENEIF